MLVKIQFEPPCNKYSLIISILLTSHVLDSVHGIMYTVYSTMMSVEFGNFIPGEIGGKCSFYVFFLVQHCIHKCITYRWYSYYCLHNEIHYLVFLTLQCSSNSDDTQLFWESIWYNYIEDMLLHECSDDSSFDDMTDTCNQLIGSQLFGNVFYRYLHVVLIRFPIRMLILRHLLTCLMNKKPK